MVASLFIWWINTNIILCRCSLNRSCSRTSRTIQPRDDSEVDFVDYRYKSDVKIDKTVILTETFVDSSTANIRQNQQTLYVDSVKDILNTAHSGFIVTGQLNMKESKMTNTSIYTLSDPCKYRRCLCLCLARVLSNIAKRIHDKYRKYTPTHII
jgi:hypothetical protein